MNCPSITIYRSFYQLDDVVDGDIRFRSTSEDTEPYDRQSGQTPVEWARDVLDEAGTTEASSYPEVQIRRTWYGGSYTTARFTDEQSEVDVSAHLFGFTPDQERAIYAAFTART
jgi:hypothetical protein